jgi:hypothetical protein
MHVLLDVLLEVQIPILKILKGMNVAVEAVRGLVWPVN